MKLQGRSRKSREAHAIFLLKISQGIYIAIFLGLIAAPINALFGHYLANSPEIRPLTELSSGFIDWGFAVIVALAAGAWFAAYSFEKQALDTLDRYFREDKDGEFRVKLSAKKAATLLARTRPGVRSR